MNRSKQGGYGHKNRRIFLGRLSSHFQQATPDLKRTDTRIASADEACRSRDSALKRVLCIIQRRVARLKIGRRAALTPDVDVTAVVRFIEELARIPHPRVIELGTRRQPGQGNTRHSAWVPHAAAYVGVDYETGEDVDLVADAHELSKHVPCESVDCVVSCSVFEHIKYPWIAALEIAKILRVGGVVF